MDPLWEDSRFAPDFKTIFPHQAWESTPVVNREYPAGFRYRFIALRDDRARLFLLSASITPNGQPPLVLARYEINPSLFHAMVAALLGAVSKAQGVSFAPFN